MRILLVCQKLDAHGGWYTYTRLLADALKKRGHAVTTVSEVGADGDRAMLPSPLDALGKPWVLPGAALRLKKIVEDVQPDVIHVTVEPCALVLSLLGDTWLSRSVLTVHGSYGIRLLEGLLQRLPACRVFKRFARFIAVSDYTKSAVAAKLAQSCSGRTCANFREHVDVIRNAIELPTWNPRKKTNAVPQALLVGGVKGRKGVLEAIDACAAYTKAYGKDVQLRIAGTYDERDAYVRSVRERIRVYGAEVSVQLLGSVSDDTLAELYASADLYLMPSPTGPNTFEGYGIAFIEAAAHGLPSIGPGTGGGAEAILNGKTGYRVFVSDPAMIAERMHRILDEGTINTEDCRAWAEEHAIDKRVLEFESVYENVTRANRGRAASR